ncbi:YopX family protein [Streptococcus orisratti]
MIPKFRAWDKENKTMYDVKSIVYTLGSMLCVNRSALFPERTLHFEDTPVMQSTGLFSTFAQDELFEDDVISWTYFDEFEDSGKARIIHRDGCWKLLDIKTGKEAWDSLFDCLENCTVFLSGNIYENPELVEG